MVKSNNIYIYLFCFKIVKLGDIYMLIKKCEFCNGDIETKSRPKRFCSVICQRKHYNRRPEIREKYRLRIKEYRRTHPEWKEKHRILAVTKYRAQRAKYQREYGKRPEVRKKIREMERFRLQNDKEFAIADRLRRSLNNALFKYSNTGKIMSSKKYGINWKDIIESLKPFPEKIKKYEVDHIIPLHSFNLNDPEQIKLAFSPSNLQWLTIEENRRKSGKILIINKNLEENKVMNGVVI